MTILIGIDVQPIDEVQDSIEEFGFRYVERLFTAQEVESCGGRSGIAAASLAGRFAAKEAVLKILDGGDAVPSWREIEVRRSTQGRPEIVLHGVAAEIAQRQGVEHLSVSLSHGGGIATAAVVAQIKDQLIREIP
jgi:holo-[acyl-carrier protein] synthase